MKLCILVSWTFTSFLFVKSLLFNLDSPLNSLTNNAASYRNEAFKYLAIFFGVLLRVLDTSAFTIKGYDCRNREVE